jgi:CBS-domain-containing membrane protein
LGAASLPATIPHALLHKGFKYHFSKYRKMNLQIPIRDIMTKSVVAIAPNGTIAEMEYLFQTQPIKHLPVLGHDGRIRGIVSKADLQKLLQWLNYCTLATINSGGVPLLAAKEIMTPNVLIVLPDDTVEHVFSVFKRYSFEALPIVDTEGGHLVGTISMSDLVHYAYTSNRRKILGDLNHM